MLVPFQLKLTPVQMDTVRKSYISKKDGYGVQVLLIIREHYSATKYSFPQDLDITVNEKPCALPATHGPINIADHLKLHCSNFINKIKLQWCSDDTRTFVIKLFLAKQLSVNQMLDRIRNRPMMPAERVQKMFLAENLGRAMPNIPVPAPVIVSLKCPAGKVKIRVPCRASTCSHFLCFDAGAYLAMNKREAKWICPVCHKQALYEDLVIDGYFHHILNSGLLEEYDEEIQVHEDGAWSVPRLASQNNNQPISHIAKTSLHDSKDDIL
ncbi:E3 SUMO-protein ligase PIAS1-like [Drosophila obscura]|uniref:E3 SUMO-protein ligase PIAS1-like n=1 Tax=Drosophila obscura TaxID=7282 RepID=UPI000BA02584|nr:E3 SUMO-protein ligase PIAS1-like [Drosophila obscura]